MTDGHNGTLPDPAHPCAANDARDPPAGGRTRPGRSCRSLRRVISAIFCSIFLCWLFLLVLLVVLHQCQCCYRHRNHPPSCVLQPLQLFSSCSCVRHPRRFFQAVSQAVTRRLSRRIFSPACGQTPAPRCSQIRGKYLEQLSYLKVIEAIQR